MINEIITRLNNSPRKNHSHIIFNHLLPLVSKTFPYDFPADRRRCAYVLTHGISLLLTELDFIDIFISAEPELQYSLIESYYNYVYEWHSNFGIESVIELMYNVQFELTHKSVF